MNERLYKELSKNKECSNPIRGAVIIFVLLVIISTIMCYIGYKDTGKLSNMLPQAFAVSVISPLLYYTVSKSQNRFLENVKNGECSITVWTIDDKWTDKFHYDKYVDGKRVTKREINKWLRLKNKNSIIEIKFNCSNWNKVDIGDKLTEVSNGVITEYIVGDFTEYINN